LQIIREFLRIVNTVISHNQFLSVIIDNALVVLDHRLPHEVISLAAHGLDSIDMSSDCALIVFSFFPQNNIVGIRKKTILFNKMLVNAKK